MGYSISSWTCSRPCPCPKEQTTERNEGTLKPWYRSPIDYLGYPYKCCCCIPLKAGVVIICFISFVAALVELTRSERAIAAIFTNKDIVFKCAKMTHLLVITGYLISCGALLIGILANKFQAINVYVWVAFIFNCICIVVVMTSLSCQIARIGMTKKIALYLTLSVVWYSFVFYCIAVVNSYKYRVFAKSVFN